MYNEYIFNTNMTYFLGFLVIALGIVMIIYTEWFVQNFGSSAWAEDKFGTSGGTRLMYKVLGILFIFGSVMVMTGAMGDLALLVFGRLFGISK